MSISNNYEAIIGLEVHAELQTRTKLFCSCPTAFGAPPNTQCCPICAGLPGGIVAGRINRRAVELAILAGLALSCDISPLCRMDRKHYRYPDLPKGYQISQADLPIGRNGHLDLRMGEEIRRVGITRVHLEEDAGKLLHDGTLTLVDGNRAGIPLIEIVSGPDLRSGAEASAYLRELRAILVACGVSDGKMQEGSVRCDVNLSVRRRGTAELGTRTETKNINSFSFVEQAIAFETERQIAELERTGRVCQRTMRYQAATGRTEPMREKEQTVDYRFLPEPELPPISVSPKTLERLRRALPELPAARRERLRRTYGLSPADAALLTETPALADYYESAAAGSRYPDLVRNLLLTDLLRFCTADPFSAPLRPEHLRELADLAGEGTVNRSTAKQLAARLAAEGSDRSPREMALREGLTQITDQTLLETWAAQALELEARAAADYRAGKQKAFGALQGRLMALSRGRADPVLAERCLRRALELYPPQEDHAHV